MSRWVHSPLRICLLGAHVDRQDGNVFGTAIDRRILLAFAPAPDAQVVFRSRDYPGSVPFAADAPPAEVSPARGSRVLKWRLRVLGPQEVVPKVGDCDADRARLAVETHLARLARYRPLERINDAAKRERAEQVRSWFAGEFIDAIR